MDSDDSDDIDFDYEHIKQNHWCSELYWLELHTNLSDYLLPELSRLILSDCLQLNPLKIGSQIYCFDGNCILESVEIHQVNDQQTVWFKKPNQTIDSIDWNFLDYRLRKTQVEATITYQSSQTALCSCGHYYHHHGHSDWIMFCYYCHCSDL